MIRHLRPVELFRNTKTRPYGIAGVVALAIAAGTAAVFSAVVGLGLSIVLIIFLLTVLVDFQAYNEENVVAQRNALVTEIADALALGDEARQRTMAGELVKAITQAPGVLATYSEPRDVPFVELLTKASEHDLAARRVQVVGWYFGYLVEGDRFTACRKFFEAGGKVDIVIPDVSDVALAGSLANMRSSDLDAAALARLTCSSVRGIARIRTEARAPSDALRVFVRRAAVNYVAYCFAGDDLILGPYEHAYDSSARAPRVHFDLRYAGSFAAFWQLEFSGMTQQGEAIDIDSWLEAVEDSYR
jgi:hypothetical protein